MNRLIVLALACSLLLIGGAAADEGRVPLFQQAVITEPGSYVVTRNFESPPGPDPLLTVQADVDIDLNGFTLFSFDTPVIHTIGSLTIRNGTVRSIDATAIQVDGGSEIVLENVIVETSALAPALQADQPTFVHVRGGRVVGMFLETDPLLGGNPSRVALDHVLLFGSIVIYGASNVAIRDNQVSGLVAVDIPGVSPPLAKCLISGNVLHGGGIDASCAGGIIEGNTIAGDPVFGASSGLFLGGHDVIVSGNTISGSSTWGIRVLGPRNHVVDNTSNNNTGFGFLLEGDDIVYRRNVGRGNQGITGPQCSASCASPDLCIASASVNNSSGGDNFLPGPPTFPGCI